MVGRRKAYIVKPVATSINVYTVRARREHAPGLHRGFKVCSYCEMWDRNIGYHAPRCPKFIKPEEDH